MVKANKFIFWTPRILAILFILFLAMILLDVLIISWKHEIVGGIAFVLAGIAHMISSVVRADVDPWYISAAFSLIIDVPAFFIGILFLIGWRQKRKRAR